MSYSTGASLSVGVSTVQWQHLTHRNSTALGRKGRLLLINKLFPRVIRQDQVDGSGATVPIVSNRRPAP
jgi:hypothetical protein